jgi:hypothetical protein
MCQLEFIDELGQESTWLNSKWQALMAKCLGYVSWLKTVISLREAHTRPSESGGKTPSLTHGQIQPGDVVRIRSRHDIRKTLDTSGRTNGCRFTNDMYSHCGKEYTVFKKVDHFFDENKGRTCKCRNLFLLEGAHCARGTCHRYCFFFWHVGWLEKV